MMNKDMQVLVKRHFDLKKQLGADHEETKAALKATADYQAACPHSERKKLHTRFRGYSYMCTQCNSPMR